MKSIRVKITTTSKDWPLERQTPGREGTWRNCKFFINKPIEDVDFWVVYDNLSDIESAYCPPNNTILITAEPPMIKRYPGKFFRQFSTAITCQPKVKHPNVIYSQPALPWHVGRRQMNHHNLSFSKDYDELVSLSDFKKERLLSVITSDKRITRGHSKRVDFVNALAKHFGDRLDVFGRGINEIEDKWDAIYPYKYHIALENSAIPNYWTEKLADTYLAGAFPLYFGCTNIGDYFPEGSYLSLPVDASQAIQIIEAAIHDQLYEKSIEQVLVARDLVLNRYNLFAVICDLCNRMPPSSSRKLITLYPIAEFRRPNFLAIAKSVVFQLVHSK